MNQALPLALITFLGAVSPGPDFAMVTRNALTHSRGAGVLTALGIALGILIHVSYCIVGLGLVISRSIVLFSVIKFGGAFYLIFIGWKGLRGKKSGAMASPVPRAVGSWAALRAGIFTNALNPKATVFILSVFTQFIRPSTPVAVQCGYGAMMALITAGWFVVVAVFFSHPRLKNVYRRFERVIERTIGGVLMAFGISLAFSTIRK